MVCVSRTLLSLPSHAEINFHPQGISLVDVRRELNAEESATLSNGTVPAHPMSESQMLVEGLEIEEHQYVLYCMCVHCAV